MVENRNNLIVDARLTEANGTAEHATALDMIEDNAITTGDLVGVGGRRGRGSECGFASFL
jgi:hypothetical protein